MMEKSTNLIKALLPRFGVVAVTCRKFMVRYKYKRKMSKLIKSYQNTCRKMAWLQDEAPKKLQMKWIFQQRRFKLYERYLSIYGRQRFESNRMRGLNSNNFEISTK